MIQLPTQLRRLRRQLRLHPRGNPRRSPLLRVHDHDKIADVASNFCAIEDAGGWGGGFPDATPLRRRGDAYGRGGGFCRR